MRDRVCSACNGSSKGATLLKDWCFHCNSTGTEESVKLREVRGDAGPAVAEMLLDTIAERDSRIKELERNLDIVIKSYELCVEYAGIDPRRSTINHARTILNKEQK